MGRGKGNSKITAVDMRGDKIRKRLDAEARHTVYTALSLEEKAKRNSAKVRKKLGV